MGTIWLWRPPILFYGWEPGPVDRSHQVDWFKFNFQTNPATVPKFQEHAPNIWYLFLIDPDRFLFKKYIYSNSCLCSLNMENILKIWYISPKIRCLGCELCKHRLKAMNSGSSWGDRASGTSIKFLNSPKISTGFKIFIEEVSIQWINGSLFLTVLVSTDIIVIL